MTAFPLTRRASELQAFKMLTPQTDAVGPPAHHEGLEWIYLLLGRLELTLGNEVGGARSRRGRRGGFGLAGENTKQRRKDTSVTNRIR